MRQFNRMTLVAAVEVIEAFNSHDAMTILEVQWGVADRTGGGGKAGRIASLAKVAIADEDLVFTEQGRVPISRAVVEAAIRAPARVRTGAAWKKLVAGLRFDGFELICPVAEDQGDGGWLRAKIPDRDATLVRMLPEDLPGLDFREAESEVEILLGRLDLFIAAGHLEQAISAFERGEWSSANGALRNFFESYLSEIALRLRAPDGADGKTKRDYLGQLASPFLLSDYNEWNLNNQKPQYVQGLMSRMHPHGGHPGLSEEEDATFRLQISLITVRLFLRRFDVRLSNGK